MKLSIVGLLILVLFVSSCNKEEKITTIKENLSRQWQLKALQKNGSEVVLKDYLKAAVWEFKENGSFLYSFDSIAIVEGDTSYVEGENSFVWKLSDDRDWILMTNGKLKTTTTTNGEPVVEEKNLGSDGDYNMEIIDLTTDAFKAKVEMKDNDDIYTYEFDPR